MARRKKVDLDEVMARGHQESIEIRQQALAMVLADVQAKRELRDGAAMPLNEKVGPPATTPGGTDDLDNGPSHEADAAQCNGQGRQGGSAQTPKTAGGGEDAAHPGIPGYGSCRCGAKWTGYSTSHCSASGCHQTFTSISTFDRHRSDGQCHDPAERGLVHVTKRYWSGWGRSGEDTRWDNE